MSDEVDRPRFSTPESPTGCSGCTFQLTSFLIPIAGLILAAVFLTSPAREQRQYGSSLFTISLVSLILQFIVLALIVIVPLVVQGALILSILAAIAAEGGF